MSEQWLTIEELIERYGVSVSRDQLYLLNEYPIQDDIWPSRRWNQEMTDYIDLSGHSDPYVNNPIDWQSDDPEKRFFKPK